MGSLTMERVVFSISLLSCPYQMISRQVKCQINENERSLIHPQPFLYSHKLPNYSSKKESSIIIELNVGTYHDPV